MSIESFVPVKDHPHLVRDKHSKAINLIDRNIIDKYEQQKKESEIKQQLIEDVKTLKSDMEDIKKLLLQLVHKAK